MYASQRPYLSYSSRTLTSRTRRPATKCLVYADAWGAKQPTGRSRSAVSGGSVPSSRTSSEREAARTQTVSPSTTRDTVASAGGGPDPCTHHQPAAASATTIRIGISRDMSPSYQRKQQRGGHGWWRTG